ncbi:uncharacterized protein LOC142662032 [Rhinoderma darwinii]|uniref:uncharacterized protein LOC142662032 n=1 Tax=Rhinoderma darwinii TaxID=43563 RepID=UPI003F66900C
MGFEYLNFCSYWRNLTSPLTCWHRGTACQFDVMKEPPPMPVVLTDLGTDVVIVTMAARIAQSIISLGKNLLQKRALYWKMMPRVCMIKALRAVVWLCWSVMDFILPLLMTTVYVYKNQSRCKAACNTNQPMNTVTIKYHWGSLTDPVEEMIVEELRVLKMETVQEVAKMADCKCDQMSKVDGMVNEGDLLPSCASPFILSMICIPSEHVESEESDVGSVDKGLEDCSQGDMSVDSGMQESWTPKYEEESDWSDDDSWDDDSNPCDEDLWASFCRSDDPYNPLSFAMPTTSPEQSKKEALVEGHETHKNRGNLDHTKCCELVKIECGTVSEKQKPKTKLCKKPVLSGFKCSHKCNLRKESEEDDQCTKKVRFSPKVTVHPIITWSYAHRMARKGPWEEYARDRSRFQRRVTETEAAIDFCLDPRHREKIWAGLQSKK